MPKLEICCGSAEDVALAAQGGADRAELNACLPLGGLTPSVGALCAAKELASIPIMAMLRPRAGGFCYRQAELQTLRRDARALLDAGADGLVFGFLHENGTVDASLTREFVRLCGGRTSVFHRAIDVAPDWRAALETLIDCGVTRVLTSGQAATALEGRATLADMLRFARGRIEILPASGIRESNVAELLAATGCTQVHLSCHHFLTDRSAMGNPRVWFSVRELPDEECVSVVDAAGVRRMKSLLG